MEWAGTEWPGGKEWKSEGKILDGMGTGGVGRDKVDRYGGSWSTMGWIAGDGWERNEEEWDGPRGDRGGLDGYRNIVSNCESVELWL